MDCRQTVSCRSGRALLHEYSQWSVCFAFCICILHLKKLLFEDVVVQQGGKAASSKNVGARNELTSFFGCRHDTTVWLKPVKLIADHGKSIVWRQRRS